MATPIDMDSAWYNALRARVLRVTAVGDGTYGYGNTPLVPFTALNTDSNKNTITADQMFLLKAHIQIARRHQVGNWVGFTETQLPDVIPGDVPLISVKEKYEQAVAIIENDRMIAGPTSLAVSSIMHSIKRYAVWGSAELLQPIYGGWRWISSGYSPVIFTEVDALWTTFDQARWYFNSGGAITLNTTHPVTSGSANNSWHNSLNKVGPVSFKALTTSATPSRGVVNNVGFYNLTKTSYTQIFNGTDIDSTYDRIPNYGFKDDFYIYAKLVDRGVRFKVELREQNRIDYISPGTETTFVDTWALTYFNTPPIARPVYTTVTPY